MVDLLLAFGDSFFLHNGPWKPTPLVYYALCYVKHRQIAGSMSSCQAFVFSPWPSTQPHKQSGSTWVQWAIYRDCCSLNCMFISWLWSYVRQRWLLWFISGLMYLNFSSPLRDPLLPTPCPIPHSFGFWCHIQGQIVQTGVVSTPGLFSAIHSCQSCLRQYFRATLMVPSVSGI